ncbi:hypothetical protein V6N11_035729 [Hibiscus sabdariffa]|uniref:Cation efflux protein transmembrane domain-containing protein n=1 Tax=Hibiscus sabdariffa TaxID=183260 RepID=A0ABR2R8L0_9ROSI
MEKNEAVKYSDSFSDQVKEDKFWVLDLVLLAFRIMRTGNQRMKSLLFMISLNVAHSTVEFAIGVFTGRIGLVSDAFHLTFGSGLLTLQRLQVLSAFTNALFLLLESFSIAVGALDAFIEDESERKHYLVVSAVTNLMVNLIGVWLFRNYAGINLVYKKSEDMNYHSVWLHVLVDSIRSAGLISAPWFQSLGANNAEALSMGLVSGAVFMLVMPLFKASGGVLLQMAPPHIPTSALCKCWGQITCRKDVIQVSEARFWEVVPGHVVGSLLLKQAQAQAQQDMDSGAMVEYVHGLYRELGIHDLTVQTDYI